MTWALLMTLLRAPLFLDPLLTMLTSETYYAEREVMKNSENYNESNVSCKPNKNDGLKEIN